MDSAFGAAVTARRPGGWLASEHRRQALSHRFSKFCWSHHSHAGQCRRSPDSPSLLAIRSHCWYCLNRAKTERDGGLGSKPQIAGGIGFFRELACQAAINHLIQVRSRFDSISFAQRSPTDKRAIGAPNFSRTTIYLARALRNNRHACAFSCPSRSAQPRSKAASLVCLPVRLLSHGQALLGLPLHNLTVLANNL